MNVSPAPVVVLGAGPAGLAMGAALRARDVDFRILDAGRQPGGIWDIDRDETPMYESAHFISSRTVSGFPDFPMPETYPDYPGHRRVFEYIRAYADHHGLTEYATFGVRVLSARRRDGGGWSLRTDQGETIEASALCVATGMTWIPNEHPLMGRFTGEEFHSFEYRTSAVFEEKRVLIVGGGNSGTDIACDAAERSHTARISLRRGYHFIPKHILGRPADVFAHSGPTLPARLEELAFGFLIGKILVGDLTRYGLPEPDHPILSSHPIVNTQILHHLSHGALEVRPDVSAVEGRTVTFSDGTGDDYDLIVWATGYRWQWPFLKPEVLGDSPPDLYLNIFHRTVQDLFFLGVFETDGAAYPIFERQAHLVARVIRKRQAGEGLTAFDRARREDRPDLRGGRRYLSSERHGLYIRGGAYEKVLNRTEAFLERT